MSPTRPPTPDGWQSRPRAKSSIAKVPTRRHAATGHQPAFDDLQPPPPATPPSPLPPVEPEDREGGVVPGLDIPPMLSATEVLAIFNRSARTLARWVAAGHLTPVRIGHARFFPADDFHRLVGRKLDQRIHDRHHK